MSDAARARDGNTGPGRQRGWVMVAANRAHDVAFSHLGESLEALCRNPHKPARVQFSVYGPWDILVGLEWTGDHHSVLGAVEEIEKCGRAYGHSYIRSTETFLALQPEGSIEGWRPELPVCIGIKALSGAHEKVRRAMTGILKEAGLTAVVDVVLGEFDLLAVINLRSADVPQLTDLRPKTRAIEGVHRTVTFFSQPLIDSLAAQRGAPPS